VTLSSILRAATIGLLAVGLTGSTGCSKKVNPVDTKGLGIHASNSPYGDPGAPGDPFGSGNSSGLGLGDPSLGGAYGAGGVGMDSAGGISQAGTMGIAPAGTIADLKPIYFAYDSAELSGDAMATLDGNAAWMLSNGAIQVQLEGHCDEKGTVEYNLNLGQLRADMVREYLASAGVPAERMNTISYGEERPVGATDNENRRVQFLVYDPAATGGTF